MLDNVEVPEADQDMLLMVDGDIEAQKDILEIYKTCAEDILKKDRKMFDLMLKEGRITKEQYKELVLKDVTIGTGLGDLGILRNSGLEETEEIIVPTRKYEHMWIDSGGMNYGGNDGTQLVLASSEIKRKPKDQRRHKIEELPLLYKNQREVRDAKGKQIDEKMIETLSNIETIAFRDEQRITDNVYTYKELAEQYDINPEKMEVKLSRENDWYMIFEEREEEIYIADLAMLNGMHSENKGKVSTDLMGSTLEMAEELSKLMLYAAKHGKKIRVNATRETSYPMIKSAQKRGSIVVEEDESRNWTETSDIEIHDMVFTVDEKKMKEELEKVRKTREKRENRIQLPER